MGRIAIGAERKCKKLKCSAAGEKENGKQQLMAQGRISARTETGPSLLKACGNGDRRRTGNSGWNNSNCVFLHSKRLWGNWPEHDVWKYSSNSQEAYGGQNTSAEGTENDGEGAESKPILSIWQWVLCMAGHSSVLILSYMRCKKRKKEIRRKIEHGGAKECRERIKPILFEYKKRNRQTYS